MMLNNESVLESYPGILIFKDVNSVIVSANQHLASFVGYKDIRDYFGRTDHDIKSAAVECADVFIEQDQLAMSSNQAQSFLDISVLDDEPRALIKTKSPWYEKGELAGTLGTSMPLQASFNKSVLQFLFEMGQTRDIHKTYQLKNSYDDYGLTRRESVVLFLLMRAKTAKQIAKSLSISSRTVESHIIAIKHKMQCATKAEMLDKALSSDLGNTLLLSMLMY